MKKYVDWDKIEEGTVSAEEACECTRSKLQPLIDFVVELFPKKMESFRGEDAEVIPEKKKPLTKDERLAMLGNVEKKLKEAIETYSQKEIPYTSDDPDFLSTNRSTVPKKSKPKSTGSTNTPALLRDQLGPSSLCVEEELKKNTKQMESFKGEDAEVIPEKKNPSKDSRLKGMLKKRRV